MAKIAKQAWSRTGNLLSCRTTNHAILEALAPAWQGAGRGDEMQNFWMDEPSSKVNYKIRAI